MATLNFIDNLAKSDLQHNILQSVLKEMSNLHKQRGAIPLVVLLVLAALGLLGTGVAGGLLLGKTSEMADKIATALMLAMTLGGATFAYYKFFCKDRR